MHHEGSHNKPRVEPARGQLKRLSTGVVAEIARLEAQNTLRIIQAQIKIMLALQHQSFQVCRKHHLKNQ